MTDIFYIDFKNKKLLSKKEIENNFIPLDQVDLEKYSYFNELIDSNIVAVKIHTKSEGVSVPTDYKNHLSMVITWSLKFKIDDLVIDEYGIKGTLSYNNKPHYTVLPWSSIWSISTSSGDKFREWQKTNKVQIEEFNGDGPEAA